MEQIIREAGLDLRNPQTDALNRASSILQRDRMKGIWLAAPSLLGIDQDHDVSITVFDVYSTAERGNRDLSESGVVIATRVESRETFATLLAEPKAPANPAEQPDNTPIPAMNLTRRTNFFLRQRLDLLPWRAGTYLVDVLLDTQTSNRLEFKLTAGAAAGKDPAVAAFIEAQKAAASGPPKPLYPAAGRDYPKFEKNEKSLEIPAENGINLSAERVAVYKPDGHSILKGGYRLAVPSSFYRDATSAPVTAAVPITLVITGNIMTGPFVVPLLLPSQEKIDADSAETVIAGQFEIDLFALSETSKVPQTYTIWAYSGAVRSQPATAAFITPEMLK
jgi:hypothetical protein